MQGITLTNRLDPVSRSHSFTASILLANHHVRHLISSKDASSPSVQLQLVCLSVADTRRTPPKHRMHFPAGAIAEINSMRMHCRRIGASKPLGEGSVDSALNVTPFISSSQYKLDVNLRSDNVPPESGAFIVGVRFATLQPQATVAQLMAPREPLVVARCRVAAAAAAAVAGGGNEDDDVIIGSTYVSLKCPLSRMRPRRAARVTISCVPAIFDLDFFLEQAARTHKWQCPHTYATSSHAFVESTIFWSTCVAGSAHSETCEALCV